MKLEDAVAEFLCGGVAVIVATRDEKLRPTLARAWGIHVELEGSAVTLCLGAPPGSRTRANLDANGAIAATFSLPSTYRTVQIKGVVSAIRELTSDDLARVEQHVIAFGREAEAVGLPSDRAHRLVDPGLVAATLDVRELFDQTPGPNAGARL